MHLSLLLSISFLPSLYSFITHIIFLVFFIFSLPLFSLSKHSPSLSVSLFLSLFCISAFPSFSFLLTPLFPCHPISLIDKGGGNIEKEGGISAKGGLRDGVKCPGPKYPAFKPLQLSASRRFSKILTASTPCVFRSLSWMLAAPKLYWHVRYAEHNACQRIFTSQHVGGDVGEPGVGQPKCTHGAGCTCVECQAQINPLTLARPRFGHSFS